jgi:acyl-CoA synthetase (AMP-forming)/AMP-acid ligase II
VTTAGADHAAWRPGEAETLWGLIARRAAVEPDGLYLTLFGQRLTLGQLYRQCLAYAGGLAALGLGPGDRLLLVLPTCHEFFFSFFGALAAGVAPVPLYPTLAPELMARVFRRSEAAGVV